MISIDHVNGSYVISIGGDLTHHYLKNQMQNFTLQYLQLFDWIKFCQNSNASEVIAAEIDLSSVTSIDAIGWRTIWQWVHHLKNKGLHPVVRCFGLELNPNQFA